MTSITLISMCIIPFKSQVLDLRGLQTASEVKSDLGFETSDQKNPCDRSFRVHLLVTIGTCQQEKSTCPWPALALQVKNVPTCGAFHALPNSEIYTTEYMLILVACFLTIKGGEKTVHNSYAEKFRFMDKRVREISRFFVAPPRVFHLSVDRPYYPQIPPPQ